MLWMVIPAYQPCRVQALQLGVYACFVWQVAASHSAEGRTSTVSGGGLHEDLADYGGQLFIFWDSEFGRSNENGLFEAYLNRLILLPGQSRKALAHIITSS